MQRAETSSAGSAAAIARRLPVRAELVFGALLLPILASALALAALGPFPESRARAMAWLCGAGACWAGAVRLAQRVRASAGLVALIFAGALGLRVTFLAADPELSDDAYRYVFEGAALAGGTSPYAHAPLDPVHDALRARLPEVAARVNHPHVPAVYPPLAELAGAGLVTLAGPEDPGRALLALRLFTTGCDLALGLALFSLLRARGRSSVWLVTWAWCPLSALESAGSAHWDAFALALALGALAVLERAERRPAREALGLALLAGGIATKLLPLVLVPSVLRRLARPVRGALVVVAVLLLVTAPLALLAGGFRGLGSGLSEYAFRWESFNLLFRWIERPLEQLYPRDESWSDPRRLARALALGMLAVLVARSWMQRLDPVRAGRLCIAGFLLLTPTLHPWYLCWIVPFLAFQPSLAWTLFLAAAPLSYWPLTGWRSAGVWSEPAWLWPALALPFLGLLAVENLRRARHA